MNRLFIFIVVNIITYCVCVLNFQLTASAELLYDIKMSLQLLYLTILFPLFLNIILYFIYIKKASTILSFIKKFMLINIAVNLGLLFFLIFRIIYYLRPLQG